MKAGKTYGIWSNYRYFYAGWRRADRLLFAIGGAAVILEIGAASGTIFLSACIVWLLEQRLGLFGVMSRLLAVLLAYILVQSFGKRFGNLSEFRVRKTTIQIFFMRLVRKSLALSYERLEEAKVQGERRMAENAVRDGLENFWLVTQESIAIAGKLLLSGTILAALNLRLVLLLTGICLVQFLGYKLAADHEQRTKEDLKGPDVTREYIQNKALDASVGKDIRIYQMQGWLRRVFRDTNRQCTRVRSRIAAGYFLYNIVEQLLQLLREGIIYGYLILQIGRGMNASLAVLYLGAAMEFADRFYDLSTCIPRLLRCQNWLTDYRRYLEEKDYHPQNEGETPDGGWNAPVTIEFRDVSFTYPGSERAVLSHLSFRLRAGEKLALVGVNGAGKSTLVKLICGFYSGYEGKILIDGRELGELNLKEYRRKIAAVFQKTAVLSASVAENVLCREETDQAACEAVLEQVGLWDKIQELPEKAQTCMHRDVEENGVFFSGGEEQKLLLARALQKGAGVLLLDEPAAALDAIAETAMYEQYRSLTGLKSVLFISHRLASTRFCDRILFLENGRVQEEGTHEELMAQKGSYYQMFEVQRKYYRQEAAHE